MIHHMSFGVSQPGRAARALAELTGATALRAPTPPFPHDAWLVVAGDDRGSLLEILPASFVFDREAPFGLRQRTARPEPHSAHVLISTIASREEIEAVARREGWPTQDVETGLFRIVKLWIDGMVLVELFARGEAERYVEAFGEKGMASLDARLRGLEAKMAAALAAKMTPAQLEAILGKPA